MVWVWLRQELKELHYNMREQSPMLVKTNKMGENVSLKMVILPRRQLDKDCANESKSPKIFLYGNER